MRVLVTGAEGMLGRRLVETVAARGHLPLPYDQPRLQLERPEEAVALLRAEAPDLVIHAAAMTDVDGCEDRADYALQVNGEATGRLARAAAEMAAGFIAVSTDYVFDGAKRGPYLEDDATGPATAYGRSKLLGEREALRHGASVLRLSWSFGPQGKNFVATVTERLLAGETLRVVDDQRGAPTYTRDSALAIVRLAEAEHAGIYHCSNGGETSWFGLAREIARRLGLPAERVSPCTSEEYPRPAPRPANSLLGGTRLEELIGPLPHWTDALERYLKEEGWLSQP